MTPDLRLAAIIAGIVLIVAALAVAGYAIRRHLLELEPERYPAWQVYDDEGTPWEPASGADFEQDMAWADELHDINTDLHPQLERTVTHDVWSEWWGELDGLSRECFLVRHWKETEEAAWAELVAETHDLCPLAA